MNPTYGALFVALVLWNGGAEAVGEPSAPPSAAAPNVSWPDTFAARRARAFFDAVEAETDEPMRQFQQTNRAPDSFAETPLAQRVSRARAIREQLGLLEIARVTAEGDYVVDVTTKSAKLGLWMKFHFAFNSEAPHYLVSMQGVPTSSPELSPATLSPTSSLAEVLEQVRRHARLPAIAAAIVEGGRIVEIAVAGVRRIDQTAQAAPDDRFHIGSIGKSMTATMIAKLVESGTLRWDLTIGEVFKDDIIRPEYREVTLEALLQHRGGIPPYTDDASFAAIAALGEQGSPTQQRAALAIKVLNESPTAPPGTVMVYSNAGYTIAAQMAERAAKKPWEDLMKGLVLDPLAMDHSGIGWPATADRPDQPLGHFGDPPDLRVQAIGEYVLGHGLAPAGDVHCSIEDLARFAAFHLQGLRNSDGLLKSQTVQRLHKPGGHEMHGYGCGWVIDEASGGKPRHWHDGSAGTYYASIVLFPEQDFAVVIAANVGAAAKSFSDQIVEWVRQRRRD